MRDYPPIRRKFVIAVLIAVLLPLGSGTGYAQDDKPHLTREDSAWARFPIGAWRRDKIVIFSPDAQTGAMQEAETSEVTTTLVSVASDHYVLQVESKITSGDSTFTTTSPPERRFFDDTTFSPNATLSAENTTAAAPDDPENQLEARQFTTEFEDESLKQIVTSVYADLPNPRHAPGAPPTVSQLVSRRTERTLKSGDMHTTVVEWRLNGRPRAVGQPAGVDWKFHADQVQHDQDGRFEWKQQVSPFVPGGIVSSDVEEWVDDELREGVATKLVEFGFKSSGEDRATVDNSPAVEHQLPDLGQNAAEFNYLLPARPVRFFRDRPFGRNPRPRAWQRRTRQRFLPGPEVQTSRRPRRINRQPPPICSCPPSGS